MEVYSCSCSSVKGVCSASTSGSRIIGATGLEPTVVMGLKLEVSVEEVVKRERLTLKLRQLVKRLSPREAGPSLNARSRRSLRSSYPRRWLRRLSIMMVANSCIISFWIVLRWLWMKRSFMERRWKPWMWCCRPVLPEEIHISHIPHHLHIPKSKTSESWGPIETG